MLVVIHSAVGGLEEYFGRGAIGGEERHAHAGRRMKLLPLKPEGLCQSGLEALNDTGRLHIELEVFEDDDELVTTEPRDGAEASYGFAGPGRSAEPFRDHLQEAIAYVMPIAIVHLFELIQVEEEDGETLFETRGPEYRLLELFHEEPSVGQAGQHIVVSEMIEAEGGLNLGGDIVLYPDKMGEIPVGVEDRGEIEFVPEQRTILAIIPQHDAGFTPGANGLPELGQRRLIGFGTLQEAAVAPIDFGRCIPGYPLKCRVDINERQVGGLCPAEGYSIGDGVEDSAGSTEIVDQGLISFSECAPYTLGLLQQFTNSIEGEGAIEYPGRAGAAFQGRRILITNQYLYRKLRGPELGLIG